MCLIVQFIRISRAKFHCNRLTAVQDIKDYARLIFWHTVYILHIYNNYRESMCEQLAWSPYVIIKWPGVT